MGWSKNVGPFFHVYGHNSVNSLHLHILDMDECGPTGRKFAYKNCPLDAVLEVLQEEAVASAAASVPRQPSTRQPLDKVVAARDDRCLAVWAQVCLRFQCCHC